MADPLAQARHDLAVANRVVSLEGIIDAFGHVSMRHPTKPDRYLISRSRSPEVVEASDIYEYTLDSEPVSPLPDGIRGYGELVIHGEIYKARPDVNAVAHHHSMAFLPFCNSGEPLVPLYHMGAQIGETVPFWDSRDEFGDTCLLVLKPEEGRSLARTLGPNWLVLMRRHGATVAAKSLTELVFRSIYSVRNAELQLMCKTQGHALSPLTPGEAKMAWDRNLQPRPQARAWEYWSTRLKKAGEYPAGPPKKSSKAAPNVAQKPSARKKSAPAARGKKR
ncbi:MAG: class II aldolase/adducin family protein [Hyphomicrobiales bacterium]